MPEKSKLLPHEKNCIQITKQTQEGLNAQGWGAQGGRVGDYGNPKNKIEPLYLRPRGSLRDSGAWNK